MINDALLSIVLRGWGGRWVGGTEQELNAHKLLPSAVEALCSHREISKRKWRIKRVSPLAGPRCSGRIDLLLRC